MNKFLKLGIFPKSLGTLLLIFISLTLFSTTGFSDCGYKSDGQYHCGDNCGYKSDGQYHCE